MLPPPAPRSGQGKDDDQSVAHSVGITRIGHLGETLQQPGHFFRRGPGILAESVKDRRDQRCCFGRHGLPGRSGGVENSMILEAVPATLSGPITWHTVMNRTPTNYAEALPKDRKAEQPGKVAVIGRLHLQPVL